MPREGRHGHGHGQCKQQRARSLSKRCAPPCSSPPGLTHSNPKGRADFPLCSPPLRCTPPHPSLDRCLPACAAWPQPRPASPCTTTPPSAPAAACWEFEQARGRPPAGAGDVAELTSLARRVAEAAGKAASALVRGL